MSTRPSALGLLDPDATPGRVPAAFFIHFDPAFHQGQAAVDRHLEYFQHTGMDVLKVQYEDRFPHDPRIQQPSDWAGMPVYGLDYYANQLGILEGIVAAAPEGTPVIQELTRVSKPGLRTYVGTKDLPRVRNGLGIAILSTSRGVMTDKEARKINVGGEVLAYVF